MHASRRRDPDRLLPADERVRAIARDLYSRVAAAPIVSPHGHVPADLLAGDRQFRDAADLFVTHDHYVTRLLHAAGTDLAALRDDADPREAWRALATNWQLFAGTASGYWIEEELTGVIGIDVPLSAGTADELFDAIGERLALPELRPRALLDRFGIEFLATTDDPLDDLAAHDALAAAGLRARVAPTFRPDRYLDPDAEGFRERVDALLAATGRPATFAGYLDALEDRRRYFIGRGAVSADHGVEEPLTVDLDPAEAEALFRDVLAGRTDAAERRAIRGHLLLQMARMSVEDGLVMTIHAGVLRNHSSPTFDRFGPDTGHDIPVPTSFVRGLRPLLERFGLERDLHLVLFTVDESTYSREIAPLAGFYPSVYIGAPWWFLDAPDAIARFRSAVTETAGFSRGSGFIDDTRAFLSIPARHDTARRADAAFLARLVAEGRILSSDAERIADDIVGPMPKRVFKL
jgi:glucuronate isomerase